MALRLGAAAAKRALVTTGVPLTGKFLAGFSESSLSISFVTLVSVSCPNIGWVFCRLRRGTSGVWCVRSGVHGSIALRVHLCIDGLQCCKI